LRLKEAQAMGIVPRIIAGGIFCAAATAGIVRFIAAAHSFRESPRSSGAGSSVLEVSTVDPMKVLATFPDPNAPGTAKGVFLDRVDFDGIIASTAAEFTGPVRDTSSLEELSRSILVRYPRGMAVWQARAAQLALGPDPTAEKALEAIQAWTAIASLEMYEGNFSKAAPWLERALELSQRPGVSAADRARTRALLGIAALRRGEVENCLECLGPSSCIFPIAREAVHTQQSGSREAIRHFTAYLDEWPGDLRVRWLVNLAYMTLGEYPENVPPAYRVPIDGFRSKIDVGRFVNVASPAGLTSRGPSLAGGSLFEDLNGDGRPDLMTTAIEADRGPSLFINRGNGTFEDRSSAAGLDPQIYALNLTRTDYDNDGNIDVLLLRGAWEKPARMTLLHNEGGAVFKDVTVDSGLGEPISSESAAWGDFDNDGWVDVFVCGEYAENDASGQISPADPRNRCRLYRNLGNGRFVDVAARAGVLNERYAKGAVWGDYDNDGHLDLFVSNQRGQSGRLYHNEGDGTFRDCAVEMGITDASGSSEPVTSFPCLFWDYDNDGWLDLFINDWKATQSEIVAGYLGLPVRISTPPRLFRNMGSQGFRDVSREVGLDRAMPTMAVNCGDIDNDGYLDLYLGSGWMSYSGLAPNRLLKNVDGRCFEDVTESSHTGHLQKGHGVSFADYDDDGDLDLFSVLGGGWPGDKGFSALFQNPGHGKHWLKVKLVGTKTNRAALGARIRVNLQSSDGSARSIHRMIGTNGSFGGNSLVETIGLGDAGIVAELTVSWPTSQSVQTFHSLATDREITITEGIGITQERPRPAQRPVGGR
jgi:hypothetical protein